VNPSEIPLEWRFIETVSPGFFFGDTSEWRMPEREWADEQALAFKLKQAGGRAVGFRRFIYDPCNGKTYIDRGWKYFKGRKFTKEEILSGFAKQVCPGIPLTDIAISNVKNNGWDCLWLADSCKLWPLEKEDKVYT